MPSSTVDLLIGLLVSTRGGESLPRIRRALDTYRCLYPSARWGSPAVTAQWCRSATSASRASRSVGSFGCTGSA